MSIKVFKPTTNGRRNMSVTDYSELSNVAPERSLLAPLKKMQAATATEELQFAIKAAEIAENTVLSTSREISRMFLQQY